MGRASEGKGYRNPKQHLVKKVLDQQKTTEYTAPAMSNTTTTNLSADMIRQKILDCKGQFVKAKWKSNPKPKASFKGIELMKVTESVVRAGIDYANLSSVQQGIENGERGEVQPLPWGEWKAFPYIIEHKGAEYLRLYPSVGNHPKTMYFVDGNQVDKETFANYLTPSDAKKMFEDERPDCFTIKSENILGIPEDVI